MMVMMMMTKKMAKLSLDDLISFAGLWASTFRLFSGWFSYRNQNHCVYNSWKLPFISIQSLELPRLIYFVSEHSERPFSTLETRSRTSSFHSRALRRDREFLPFSLRLRDEIENFFLLISWFETRTRISFMNLRHRDENENRDWDNSRENFRELHLLLVYWQIFSKKGCYFLKIS